MFGLNSLEGINPLWEDRLSSMQKRHLIPHTHKNILTENL
jgi:hypothetical protein